jgi:enoyl-CoA hydratase
MSELATYSLEDGIGTIRIDDGKVNAFSIPMLTAIHTALDRAEADRAVTLIVGREGYFSAGFDLKVFTDTPDQALEMVHLGATLSQRILAFPRPVVAAATGHAIAAGSFLLLAADARVGAAGAFRIGLNEVQIGLTVPWFAIELARYRLRPAEFDRGVVSGHLYGPEAAAEAGFLDLVVDPSAVEDAARETAVRLAAINADAHEATKLRARAEVIDLVRSAVETELDTARAAA